MSTHSNFCLYLLLAAGLAACSTPPGSTSKRSEHHYAFSKPSAAYAPAPIAPQQPAQKPERLADRVYFDFDSYSVRPGDREIITSHAQWLRSHPERSLTLRGHTDTRGGAEYNLALGQKRAESVRQNLLLLGVGPSKVEAISYGREQLADSGTSEEAHQRNRRVEFEYR